MFIDPGGEHPLTSPAKVGSSPLPARWQGGRGEEMAKYRIKQREEGFFL